MLIILKGKQIIGNMLKKQTVGVERIIFIRIIFIKIKQHNEKEMV